MSLARQAFRLLKTEWQDPQYLAEELYLMFLQDVDPTFGPTTVQQTAGDVPFQLPADLAEDPLPPLDLPALDLPEFPENPFEQEQTPQEQGAPQEGGTRYQHKEIKTTTQHTRVVVPGQVGSGSQGRYAVRLYPNSTQDNAGTADDPFTVAVEVDRLADGTAAQGVKQLDGATDVPQGTWTLVFRHTEWEIKTIRLLESGVGIKGEKEISRTTEIRVKARHHEMQATRTSDGGVPVKIVSGGPGSSYEADAYPLGLGGATQRVTVTVLQLDPSETIPPGQWYIAAKIGSDYFIQPPVWVAQS